MALTQQPTKSSPIPLMALGSVEISKEGIDFETLTVILCFTNLQSTLKNKNKKIQ